MSTDAQVTGIDYIKTFPGILKIAQEVCNFIGMVCVAATAITPRGDAFIACSVIAFLLTGLLLICYITQIAESLQVPWYRVEFFYSLVIIVFYIVTSGLVVDMRIGGYIAGGIFGFIAAVLYIIDAYHKFKLAATS